MTTFKVGYFVGSLSSTSINRLLARALVRLAPPELQLVEIPFKDLPLYSPAYESNYPPVARVLKDDIRAADSGRPEERDRLGEPPVREKLLRSQAVGGDRRLTGPHRDRRCAAALA